MPVDPQGSDLRRLLAEDEGGPVVMLNLLRYEDGIGARDSYLEYARRVQPFLERCGAELVYAGDCSSSLVAPEEWDWDAILLVRYPSRRAFAEMVADPEYQRITHLRTEALSEAVLQATHPWRA